MNYRRLGRAGVKVSELSLGTWLTFGHGISDETARAILRRAFELGVNLIDTADVYAKGAAEACLGRELAGYRRQDYVLATKCFHPITTNVNDRGLSRKHIFESVDGCLRRLQTDYLDLMQCHRHDPEVELEEIVRAFDDLIRQGKVLYWGVSEWPAEQINQACDVARQLNAPPPVSNQPEYSLAARRVETNGVQRSCAERGLGMIVWSPLRQGLLTGKYAGQRIPGDSRAASDKMSGFLKTIDQRVVEQTERLRPIAQRHACSLAQLAIAWLLTRSALSSVILGATSVKQLEENVAATQVRLSDGDLAELDRLFPAAEFQ